MVSLYEESGHLNRIEQVGDKIGVVAGKARFEVKHNYWQTVLEKGKSLC